MQKERLKKTPRKRGFYSTIQDKMGLGLSGNDRRKGKGKHTDRKSSTSNGQTNTTITGVSCPGGARGILTLSHAKKNLPGKREEEERTPPTKRKLTH